MLAHDTSGRPAGDPLAADDDLRALAEHFGIQIWLPDEAPSGRGPRIMFAARESVRGRLPPRYATDTWDVAFRSRLTGALTPGMRILDVGAGARPTVPPTERPDGCVYVGLDVDDRELRKAAAGSYDEIVVSDVCDLRTELVGGFDLILTWLTLEHVRPLSDALQNLGRYQRPGGRFLGYLAGKWSMHAVLNRAVPHGVAQTTMQRLFGREPETVFPAYYDQCSYSGLTRIVQAAWRHADIVPFFTGGWYFQFSRPLRAGYLAYEEWAYSGGHRNLASYYLVDAVA